MTEREEEYMYMCLYAERVGGVGRREKTNRQENSGAAATITAKILTNGIST